jgi:hypothetical protein
MLFVSVTMSLLIDSLWIAALVAMLCALMFEVLRPARAAVRHAVGMLGLIAMVLLPIVWFILRTTGAGVDSAFSDFETQLYGSLNIAGLGAVGHGEAGKVAPGPMQDWTAVVVTQCWLLGVTLMLAWQLRADRNIIGAVWEPDSRTVRVEEEAPRGLTDTLLPDRVIRRISADGTRPPLIEAGGDRLLDVRPLLSPASVHGEYALATGASGELWVIQLGQHDARWQLTDVAAGAFAWNQ